jgi:hypothetical protein
VVLVEVSKRSNSSGVEVRIPPFEILAFNLKGIFSISEIKTAVTGAFDEARQKEHNLAILLSQRFSEYLMLIKVEAIEMPTSKCEKSVKDIQAEEKDECVSCGEETIYSRETMVDNRQHYIDGGGQLCSKCYKEIYGAK